MKKILFVIQNLEVDGASKSLISLLESLRHSGYKIDLFLFEKRGPLIKHVPNYVNILDSNLTLETLGLPLLNSCKKLIYMRQWNLFISRLIYSIKNYVYKTAYKNIGVYWSEISNSVGELVEEYDAAIGYNDGLANYFVGDKVVSKKKIGWNHCNYKLIDSNTNFDRKYYEDFNHIATISLETMNRLRNVFPDMKEKFVIVPNIVSENTITRLSLIKSDVKLTHKGHKILTIGRLSEVKGIDIAIGACKLLIEKGYDIRWYVLGDGPDKKKLKNLCKRHGLENHFIFLGVTDNPYAVIKAADIYVQPSRSEGYGIAIAEAKILNKPIVASDLPSIKEQIIDGYSGILSKINSKDFSEKIEELLVNKGKMEYISNNLLDETVVNEKRPLKFIDTIVKELYNE